MKTGRWVGMLCVVALLIMAGHEPVSAQAAKGEPYKIGVTFPLVGPLGAWGQILVPAIEIGVQHVNEAGGVNGRPLELVIEDTKGTPDGAVAAMRKVVQVDKVPIIITIFTNVVTAQMPLADQLKVPIISTVEAPGLVSKSPWAFAHSVLLTKTLPLISERWKRENVKRLFAFHPNTAIAKIGSPLVKAEAEKLGIQHEEVLFKLGDTDFRGLVARAKDFKPDAIFIWGHGTPEEGAIMKQIRELGMTTQMYGGCSCVTARSYQKAAGGAANGLIYGGFKYDKQAAKRVIDVYRAKLGFEPDYAVIENYDIVRMIAQAIKTNGYTAEGIRTGLLAIKDMPSTGGGSINMGQDRQSLVPVALYQVKDIDKPEFVEIKP